MRTDTSSAQNLIFSLRLKNKETKTNHRRAFERQRQNNEEIMVLASFILGVTGLYFL